MTGVAVPSHHIQKCYEAHRASQKMLLMHLSNACQRLSEGLDVGPDPRKSNLQVQNLQITRIDLYTFVP